MTVYGKRQTPDVRLTATGNKQPGSFKLIADTQEEAESIAMVPGKIYEHRIQTQFLPDWIVGPVAEAILSIESLISGTQILYFEINRGLIIYQFWIPVEATRTQIPTIIIWAVVSIVLAIVGVFVLNWVLGELVGVAWNFLTIALLGFGIILIIYASSELLRRGKVISPERVIIK